MLSISMVHGVLIQEADLDRLVYIVTDSNDLLYLMNPIMLIQASF
jgi:hypothetical protein